jgi:hypothetical protein
VDQGEQGGGRQRLVDLGRHDDHRNPRWERS